MARGPNEKNFGADIEKGLAEQVNAYIDQHGLVRRKLMTVLLELFMRLPEHVKAMLLHAPAGSEGFEELVRGIVRDELARSGVDAEEKPREPEPLGEAVAAVEDAQTHFEVLAPEDQAKLNDLRTKLAPKPAGNEREQMQELKEAFKSCDEKVREEFSKMIADQEGVSQRLKKLEEKENAG
ncbi:hypothetical protein STSP2_03181 [Anaerohalosphaera lusitana]|uniref:Uncharacterized protein n=1 Tax=Anaerohalosphaera lusitana TaxID=1936003 RepID=A0A1U9NPX0_9BACT|nr:hypothetical protein [Anaerohalosphaera lusitana]AQT69981.1 hypothetical protein STSP2_03181 [Anaerohalosphaera lusitana]